MHLVAFFDRFSRSLRHLRLWYSSLFTPASRISFLYRFLPSFYFRMLPFFKLHFPVYLGVFTLEALIVFVVAADETLILESIEFFKTLESEIPIEASQLSLFCTEESSTLPA